MATKGISSNYIIGCKRYKTFPCYPHIKKETMTLNIHMHTLGPLGSVFEFVCRVHSYCQNVEKNTDLQKNKNYLKLNSHKVLTYSSTTFAMATTSTIEHTCFCVCFQHILFHNITIKSFCVCLDLIHRKK